jgi:Pyruvate/2-oxoacid:ferredoxin oxidoreductase delta subunit
MSKVDHSMSLTPPAKMNGAERIGAFITGLGILALLVAFLSATPLSPWLIIGIGGAFMASAGILTSINREKYGQMIVVLLVTGIISIVFLGIRMDLPQWPMFFLVFGVTAIGACIYFWGAFGKGPAGIKNNGIFHSSATRQAGVLSWIMAIAFTGFYIILYWFPDQLFGLVSATDPLYHAITGKHTYYIDEKGVHITNQWFVYGLIYTLAVLVMGFRFILKYRHSKYQIVRTLSVAFFQLIIAFSLPAVFEALNYRQDAEFEPVVEQYVPVYQTYAQAKDNYFMLKDSTDKVKNAGGDATALEAQLGPLKTNFESTQATTIAYYEQNVAPHRPQVKSHIFSYFWPLSFYSLEPYNVESYVGEKTWDGVQVPHAKDPNNAGDTYRLETKAGLGTFGWIAIGFGIFMSFVGVVLLTYFFGKRWYCSWVCGCGGLAETAGDPFRQQSDKSLKAWRIERWTIHSVLVLVTAVTALLLLNWKFHFLNDGLYNNMKSGYGFLIGSIFAGVVGTGFYPILGSRVWCRFGCPQAAILGILQKYFSRFRITTNGGQCISCGNCSTYCEMGIDVKAYAQRGENIVRASCVGCGVCSSVCPRGVLNLENGPTDTRYNGLEPISISLDEIKVEAR